MKEPMTLAIDCRMIGSGGIGTYISSLIPHFLDHARCFLLGQEEQISAWREHPNAVLLPCNVKMFSLKEALFFPHSIAKKINKCDAFYTPYCGIPSGIKVKVFATIHDVVFLDVKGLSSYMGTLLRKIVYLHAARRSVVLFTVSEFSASRIRRTLKLKHKNIVVAPDALPDWLVSSPMPPAQKKRQILFVGNIKRHKGLGTLLEAFSKAQSQGLDSKLIIVGAQSGFRTRDGTVAKTRPNVQFAGKVSDEELLNLYRTSALLVQPSVYEGFGLPPLEALSLGTRALISDIPVFKEIYDGFPVTYFKTGDSGDLCNKLLQCMKKDAATSPLAVPQKYSFARSAKIILDTISYAT